MLLRTNNGQVDIVDSVSFAERILQKTADSDVRHRPGLINLDGRNIAEDIVRQDLDIWLKIRTLGTFRAHCIRVADRLLIKGLATQDVGSSGLNVFEPMLIHSDST